MATISTAPHRREPFDPERTFLVMRSGNVAGFGYEAGAPFNKSSVSSRRLRQMYEARWLKMAPIGTEVNAVPPPKPDFNTLSDDGLRRWLRHHGNRVRTRLTREKLLELANTTWEKRNGISNSNRAGQHSSERLPGPANDGNAEA